MTRLHHRDNLCDRTKIPSRVETHSLFLRDAMQPEQLASETRQRSDATTIVHVHVHVHDKRFLFSDIYMDKYRQG